MKIEILSVALVDIQPGKHFYEQRQEGLGAYFPNSLFSDIDALLLFAGVHQQIFGYYRALSKRFPCATCYEVIEQSIQVWRVLNCWQKPSHIKSTNLLMQHE